MIKHYSRYTNVIADLNPVKILELNAEDKKAFESLYKQNNNDMFCQLLDKGIKIFTGINIKADYNRETLEILTIQFAEACGHIGRLEMHLG